MKKIYLPVLVFCLMSLNTLAGELKSKLLDAASKKVSDVISTLPGEGITEFNLEFNEREEPSWTLLGVRDLSKTENSNFFTQLSMHNDDVSGHERIIGNFGLGYRLLNSDKSMMFGVNAFYDHDFSELHRRASLGAEASASILDLNINWYQDASHMQNVNGTEEAALGGLDYNITSQIPHMPWAKINWQGYTHNAKKAGLSTTGDVYSLELAISPYLQLDISRDISNHEDGNTYGTQLTFLYPPRENKPTLADGLTSDEMFVKENMEDKLSGKVRRNNNIVVEIQGSVIITSK